MYLAESKGNDPTANAYSSVRFTLASDVAASSTLLDITIPFGTDGAATDPLATDVIFSVFRYDDANAMMYKQALYHDVSNGPLTTVANAVGPVTDTSPSLSGGIATQVTTNDQQTDIQFDFKESGATD